MKFSLYVSRIWQALAGLYRGARSGDLAAWLFAPSAVSRGIWACWPRSEARPVARSAWIDTAKGIAIVLMVYGHVAKGLISARIMADTPNFWLLDSVLTSFRMPLLFFLAGLWLLPTVQKYGSLGFTGRRAEQLLWPYAVWMLLHSGLMMASGALFFVSLFGIAFARTPAWTRGPLVLLAAVAYLWRSPLPHELPLTHVWGALVFFLAGAWVGSSRALHVLAAVRAWWPPLLPQAVVVLLASAAGAQLVFHAQGLRWTDFGGGTLALALVCILAICALSAWIAPWSRWLQVIGSASLAIYVAHVIFAAAWRMVLSKVLGVTDPAVHIVTGMLVGVGAPLLLYQLAPKLRVGALFRWPGRAAATGMSLRV